ncbi:MAG TPA: hypothetical protein VMZ28_09215 [Kofleriaceae bacterium]|nr:hypothetical protein [Kofleriaceae bacterium]
MRAFVLLAATVLAPVAVHAQEVPPPAPPADLPPPGTAAALSGHVGYDDGLFIATGEDEFRLRVGGWVIARWAYSDPVDDVTQRLSLPSVRLFADGHTLGDLGYAISLDAAEGEAQLRDAYIDRPIGGAVLRVGRHKRAFARQHLASLAVQQFTERALTDELYQEDRDLGVRLYRVPDEDECGVEVHVGAYNGYAPLLPVAHRGGGPALLARLGWTSAHMDGFDEADLDGGPARLAFGAGYLVDAADATVAEMTHETTVDAVLKANGWSLSGAWFGASYRERPGAARQWVNAGHAQLGYFIVPRRVELAARGSVLPVELLLRQRREAVGVLNLHASGHRRKLQIESGVMQLRDPREVQWLVRVQTQLVF